MKGIKVMNIDLIFQIAGVGIIVAVLNQLLTRAGREEQALLTTIAGLVVVLFIVTQQIGELFNGEAHIQLVGDSVKERSSFASVRLCCAKLDSP